MRKPTKLNSYEEYAAIYNEIKTKNKRLSGNLYLFPDDIRRYISLGRLYAGTADSLGLLIFTDEGAYYQLHAMLDETINPAELQDIIAGLPEKKPIISRLIGRQSVTNAKTDMLKAKLKSAGFSERDTTLEMRLDIAKQRENIQQGLGRSLRFLERRGFTISTATADELCEMQKLRNVALDPLHFRYETEAEIKAELDKGHFQCVYDAHGNICATHRYEVINNYAIGHVIAVTEEYRKLGIGPTLVYRFLDELDKQGIGTCYCWVIADNMPSLDMHGRIGFELTGKQSEQLIFGC